MRVLRVTRRLFIAVLLVAAVIGANAQQSPDQFNARIHRELTALDPTAEALFRQADEARQRGDHRAAADLYSRVVARVPSFVHAKRRGAMEEVALGNRRKGLALLEQAVSADASAENLSMLAIALIQRNGEDSPKPAELDRAGQLAQRACTLEPDDPATLGTCATVAVERRDLVTLDVALSRLAKIEPDALQTRYLEIFAAMGHNDFDRALRALDRARAAGLPEAEYQQLHATISQGSSLSPGLVRHGGVVVATWIGGALLLFLAGSVLSVLALRSSTRVPATIDGRPSGGNAAIRLAYRFVLLACCVYYYVSIPLLLVLVLVVGGGVVYGLISVGHVPIKLLLIAVLITGVTAWSIVRSLFVRGKNSDPGIRLEPDQERRFWQLVTEVASRVGTRPVDSVYLTAGTEVAVFERGGLFRQLTSRSERCLILGVGTLDGMRLAPFKAVLAHEYGHFSNRDTAGGGLALGVRRSVVSLAVNLARGGAATWYNPAWLFVQGFHRLFLRVSQGASRLQEVLADRWAAALYGAQAFEDGLRHVIDRTVRFNAHVNATAQDILHKRAVQNLYQYAPAKPASAADLEAQVQRVLEAEPSPYDSHPRPLDRFRWVHSLDVKVIPASDDAMPVWDLFADRAALEERMTAIVRALVVASQRA